MNAVEIEQAITELAEQPFDREAFPFDFLRAFGNPETTTGGNALKFYASVRLDIRRSTQIKDTCVELLFISVNQGRFPHSHL